MGELSLLPAPNLAVLAGSLPSGAIIYITGIGKSHKLELFRLSPPSPPSESIIKYALSATDDSRGGKVRHLPWLARKVRGGVACCLGHFVPT